MSESELRQRIAILSRQLQQSEAARTAAVRHAAYLEQQLRAVEAMLINQWKPKRK